MPILILLIQDILYFYTLEFILFVILSVILCYYRRYTTIFYWLYGL